MTPTEEYMELFRQFEEGFTDSQWESIKHVVETAIAAERAKALRTGIDQERARCVAHLKRWKCNEWEQPDLARIAAAIYSGEE